MARDVSAVDEWVAATYGKMTEVTLEARVRQAALELGWLYYHTHDSRRSDPGFPDCVFVRGPKVLFRELKAEHGKLTKAQRDWQSALLSAGADYGVWRPTDWGKGVVLSELAR